MTTAYLNGEFLPLEKAQISVLDRGFLYADGVYETLPVFAGKPFLLSEHLGRLQHSLDAMALPITVSEHDWAGIINRLIQDNDGENFSIYLQITRGADDIRRHEFPKQVKPTILMCAFPMNIATPETLAEGLKAITVEDKRWGQCHIKGIGLTANILALEQARKQQADEAIFIRAGFALETTRSNLFVAKDGNIFTPPLEQQLLGGITRGYLIQLLKALDYTVEESPILEAQLNSADEIWISASIKEIRPILSLNGKPVAEGTPGPIWQAIIPHFIAKRPV